MTRKASNKRRKAVLNVTPSDISPAVELIATNLDLLSEILACVIHNPIQARVQALALPPLRPPICRQPLHPKPETFLHLRRMMSIDRHVVQYNIAFIVCNPTTKKYTLLPIRDGVVIGWSAYLVFDPSKSPHHYKVVLVGSGHHRNEIDIYSSQSLCWRKAIARKRFFGRGVFWNGAIHWLTDDDFLKRFDVDVEEIISMPNPQSPKILPRCKIMYFGECGGCLILIQSRSYCPSGLRILELERDYSGWVVKCRINFRPLISTFPEMKSRRNNCLHGFKVLYCAVKGESERGLVLLLAIPGRIVSYNPKKKTWDVLRDLVPHESEALDLNTYYAVPFIETVFPLNKGRRLDEMEKVGVSGGVGGGELGLEIRESQCLDTDLNQIRNFAGKSSKICVRRSTLLAIACADGELSDERWPSWLSQPFRKEELKSKNHREMRESC
ncbi:hypothetical protein RHSIM_Rhsim01G0014700 [Rhododendron simsii]|uniref:F-box associated beta-propeller type 3 domain-containing protein n=1 Tax=Rhododendron simsii TaxID=118357 RepID=A0A834LVJ6_RHOSS|nr:hypothetical protein RHSIM_Rhsim01G0014700 [Rhododendron simsii]